MLYSFVLTLSQNDLLYNKIASHINYAKKQA